MKYNKSLLGSCLLFILSSTTAIAQYYFGEFTNHSITLRSDLPSKSVLVSNIFHERIGDISPVIIAASWEDSGRQAECRSLLEFNYISLPKTLSDDPSLISSAELILYPVKENFQQTDIKKPGKFIVRRVLENWEDSATVWLNQPAADTSMQVVKTIKIKQKNNPVSVDVTKLLINMLRSGNKGFMICPESPQPSMVTGGLFASPKNEDEALRPLLVINFRQLVDPSHVEIDKKLRRPKPQQTSGGTPVIQPVSNN
jgi:hypothetical protein